MRHDWAKYAQEAAPRYTSYPTAASFHPGVDEATARDWAASLDPRLNISVYAHIPFCEQLCWYCGCNTTIPNGYSRVARYLDRLHREIDLWSEALGRHAGAAHIHFGGGTPNALKAGDMFGLIERLREAFAATPDAEIAAELDPRTLTDRFVAAAAEAGLNRASLGVQDFDPEVQAAINRVQSFEEVDAAVRLLRAAGVRNVNMDLVYGLPHQTVDGASETARLAALMKPDRLAVFGYAHVPWFKKHQRMIRDEDLPGAAERFAQAEALRETLEACGYVPIGLDHYALPHDPLARAASDGRLRRNFQGYTTDPCDTLIGLGASSISSFRQGYCQSATDMKQWADAVEAGRLPIVRGVAATDEDRLRRAVIERLMCDLEVDLSLALSAYGRPENAFDDTLEALQPLARDGLCKVQGRTVVIPDEARILVRTVAKAFDAASDLKSVAPRHAKAL